MRRRSETNVGTMFMATGAASAILGQAMIHGIPAIGEAVGNAVASGINRKRTRDWNAAVDAKAAEAEKVLAEFDDVCRELARHPKFLSAVIRDQFDLKRELENALNRATVFDAYDALVVLIARIRLKLSRHRVVADALFNATVNAKLRAASKREAA
jgi:hypothetical protein